jgi:glycosyltransferase involved in cell wall biosynthesis
MAKKHIVVAVTNDMVTDQRVDRICRSLVSAGLEVTVAARVLPTSVPVTGRPYRVVRFKLPFLKGMLFYASYNLRLFFYLLFKKLDAITSNDLDTLPACRLVSLIRRKPIVYDSHEYYTQVPELVNRPSVRHFWEVVEKYCFKGLKNVSTVCLSIANVYQRQYGVKVHVVRNVPMRMQQVEDSQVNIQVKPDEKVIIYQGALNLGRGIENIIDAMQYIDNVKFIIAGGGDIENDLRERVQQKNLTDKILFTGRLPFLQLRNYTLKADLGVSLEENLGLNYYFSLPNKLFDYIQCGVPVLCSAFPETSRIIEGYKIGRTTQERDPLTLSVLIKEMLFDDNQRNIWKENLKVAACELCWENEEQVLLTMYREAGIL